MQKIKENYDDENDILFVKPLKTFFGGCDVTNMLIKLGNLDISVFNGITFLLKLSEENNKKRSVYIGGDKIYSFITMDHVLKYIYNMGNNMIPYSITVDEENVYFLSPHCKFLKRLNIKDKNF